MCLAVFLATDDTAPAVPFAPGDSVFHAEPIAGAFEYENVRRQFSKPHVMYLGAHSGCGCGFRPEGDAPGNEVAPAASRDALRTYVETVTAAKGGEMFVCWEGAFADAPATRLRIPASELATRTDWLDELTFVEIPRAAGHRTPS
jgi:hypothetical protein